MCVCLFSIGSTGKVRERRGVGVWGVRKKKLLAQTNSNATRAMAEAGGEWGGDASSSVALKLADVVLKKLKKLDKDQLLTLFMRFNSSELQQFDRLLQAPQPLPARCERPSRSRAGKYRAPAKQVCCVVFCCCVCCAIVCCVLSFVCLCLVLGGGC